jgi:hypothetical protein
LNQELRIDLCEHLLWPEYQLGTVFPWKYIRVDLHEFPESRWGILLPQAKAVEDYKFLSQDQMLIEPILVDLIALKHGLCNLFRDLFNFPIQIIKLLVISAVFFLGRRPIKHPTATDEAHLCLLLNDNSALIDVV